MGWMSLVLAMLQLAPTLLAAITDVETTIKGAHLGKTKKALVMAAVSTATDHKPAILPAVSEYIDTAVTALNAASVFTHALTTPAPPAS